MATTTPNYGWDVPTSSDYVKLGAVAIETLGDDIDASLFSITGGKNVGQQFISNTSFTGASSVAIDNVFTSAYTNYRAVINITNSTATANHTLNYRAGGSTNSTANYFYGAVAIVFGSATVQGSQAVGATGVAEGSRADSGAPSFTTYNFGNPQVALRTYSQALTVDSSVTRQVGSLFNATTQFDGFIITPQSGTITGNIRVYGLRNS